MKNLKTFCFILFATIFFFSSCTLLGLDDNDEEPPESREDNPPIISIVSPNEGATFYTEGGSDTPDVIVCNAGVSDESTIEKGSVTIYNSGGEVVKYYEELAKISPIAVNGVYASFKTVQDGDYVVEFKYPVGHGKVFGDLLRNMPFRMFRHSKYVVGMDMVTIG